MASSPTDVRAKYPDYQVVIGIEVHVQLKTNAKIFCSCPNQFGDQPNTNICPVCTGQPGSLPVLNAKVVDAAIMAGLATNCSITRRSMFARKHYMYPDLPKNYQITQDDAPICEQGTVSIAADDGSTKQVRLLRIHMEEDAGKNIHVGTGYSLVNLNRAGTPLLEIVSQPDMCSSAEAKSYLTRLHSIVRYLGISEANMEEGSFRADINVSVNKKTDTQWGTRVELKNINSFRFVVQALEYEIERQIMLLESGQRVRQETRLWDSKQQKTTFMRSKELAQDYRYCMEPDLPMLCIDDAWIERIKKQVPELPHQKFDRFVATFGLTAYEADILTSELDLANFFQEAATLSGKPKQVCNWLLRDVLGYLKEHKKELGQLAIGPAHIAQLVKAIDAGTINSKTAQEVFADMMQTGQMPEVIIAGKGLASVGSREELEQVVLRIMEQNPDTVAKYRSGNTRVFTFFVGQVMKETKGRANPTLVEELLKQHLEVPAA